MEDAEEDACDGSSIDDEEEDCIVNENDVWNLMVPDKEISGISLEDKMGKQFIREAGNSPSYK